MTFAVNTEYQRKDPNKLIIVNATLDRPEVDEASGRALSRIIK